MNNPHVIQILPKIPSEPLRVGIYCRISTKSNAQIHSLINQISFLTQLVANTPKWKLVDIYIDIKSGSNGENRDEFNRMLVDARNHKLNFILIKSCSRFFRNVTQALQVLHELDDLGVYVRFDEENIETSDSGCWLYFTLYESYAESDNEDRSESIKWGIRKKAEFGSSTLFYRKCYGYANDEDGHLVVDPEQAQIVSFIFDFI